MRHSMCGSKDSGSGRMPGESRSRPVIRASSGLLRSFTAGLVMAVAVVAACALMAPPNPGRSLGQDPEKLASGGPGVFPSFDDLVENEPFDKACAALDKAAAEPDRATRAAAMVAKARLIARRDLVGRAPEITGLLEKARSECAAMLASAKPDAAAEIADFKWRAWFLEARYLHFAPNGAAAALKVYEDMHASADIPPAFAERAAFLLADRTVFAAGRDQAMLARAREKAAVLFRAILEKHKDSRYAPYAALGLADALMPDGLLKLDADPHRSLVPSVEWESRRSAALEALSAALPAAGGGRLAEMIANRVRSLKEHACRFDSDGVLSAYSRTNAADPLSMPSAGAAVPAEIVREIEGEWRIRRVSTDELQRGVPSRVFGGGTDAARFGDVMARGKSTGESGAVPLPGPGIYVFEQENADSLRGIEVTVTDMVVLVRAFDRTLDFLVLDRVTAQPVQDCNVHVSTNTGDAVRPIETLSAVTGADGTARVSFPGDDGGDSAPYFRYAAVRGPDAVFGYIDTWLPDYRVEYRARLITDRPIYRAGETVGYLCVVGLNSPEGIMPLTNDEYEVRVTDYSGKVLHRCKAAADEFGAFSGSFVVGENAALGAARLRIKPVIDRRGPSSREDSNWLVFINDFPGSFAPDKNEILLSAYRRPEFKVSIDAGKARFSAGGRTEVTVESAYYHGSPVARATVEFTVDVYPHEVPDPLEPRAGFRDTDHSESDFENSIESFVYEAETDENGVAKFRINCDAFGLQACRFDLIAQVRDLSGRSVSESSSFIVSESDLFLFARPRCDFASPGEEISFDIAAVRSDSSPVSVRGFATLLGEKGAASPRIPFESRADGSAELKVKMPAPGQYSLLLESADGSAASSCYQSIRVHGAGQREGGLAVMLDRRTAAVGDLVGVAVSAPGGEGTAWIAVESGSVHFDVVAPMHDGIAKASFKVTADMVPNVVVTAVCLCGGKTYAAGKPLLVSDLSRVLTITMTPDRAVYGPSEEGMVEFDVRDASSAPVSCRIAFLAADKAIFDLTRSDPPPLGASFLPDRKARKVTIGATIEFETENFHDPWPPRSGSMVPSFCDDGSPEPPNVTVRRNFNPLACWAPRTITGADGKASVKMKFSDLLTVWKMRADAVGAGLKFGTVESALQTRKDLLVRLSVPRFFRAGDEARVPVSVHNLSDGQVEAELDVSATGADVGRGWPEHIKVPAGGEWNGIAVFSGLRPGKIIARAEAVAGDLSDSIEIEIPCLPDGVDSRFARSGMADLGEDGAVDLPDHDGIRPVRLTVRTGSSLAMLIREALPYLADYPYGCVEQTMSRFLPSLAAMRGLSALGITLEGRIADVPSMVEAGILRLQDFQHDDGGFGWWMHDESDVWMTAYVYAGLAEAAREGFDVDAGQLELAREFLLNACASGPDSRAEIGAFARMSLALGGAAEIPGLESQARAEQELDSLGDDALAYLVIALHAAGKKDLAAALAGKLSRRVTKINGQYAVTSYWKHWSVNASYANATCLRALVMARPEDPLIEQIANGLLRMRKGSRWSSTTDTAMAVLALCDLLSARGDSAGVAPDVRVLVDGRPIAPRAAGSSWIFEIEGGALAKLPQKVRISSGSQVYWSVEYDFLEAGDVIEPAGTLNVRREIRVLSMDGAGNWNEGRVITSGSELSVGDVIRVTLRIGKKPEQSLERLVVTDPLLSCAEPLTDDRAVEEYAEQGFRAEFRDSAAVFFVPYVPRGGLEISYDARIEREGVYRAFPAIAEEMYDPDKRGRSGDLRITVRPRGARPSPAAASAETSVAERYLKMRAEVDAFFADQPCSRPEELFEDMCYEGYEPFWEWVKSEDFVTNAGRLRGAALNVMLSEYARRSGISSEEGLKAFLADGLLQDIYENRVLDEMDLASFGVFGRGPAAVERLAGVLASYGSTEDAGAVLAFALFREAPFEHVFAHIPRLLRLYLKKARTWHAQDLTLMIEAIRLRMGGHHTPDLIHMNITRATGVRSGFELFLEEPSHYLRPRRLQARVFVEIAAAMEDAPEAVLAIKDEKLRLETAEAILNLALYAFDASGILSGCNDAGGIEIGADVSARLESLLDGMRSWLSDPVIAPVAADALTALRGKQGFDDVLDAGLFGIPEVVCRVVSRMRPGKMEEFKPLFEIAIKTWKGDSRGHLFRMIAKNPEPGLVSMVAEALPYEIGCARQSALELMAAARRPELGDMILEAANKADPSELGFLAVLAVTGLPDRSMAQVLDVLIRRGLPIKSFRDQLYANGMGDSALYALVLLDIARMAPSDNNAVKNFAEVLGRLRGQALEQVKKALLLKPEAVLDIAMGLPRQEAKLFFSLPAIRDMVRSLGERDLGAVLSAKAIAAENEVAKAHMAAAMLSAGGPPDLEAWRSQDFSAKGAGTARDLVLAARGDARALQGVMEESKSWNRDDAETAFVLLRVMGATGIMIARPLLDHEDCSVRALAMGALGSSMGVEGLEVLLDRVENGLMAGLLPVLEDALPATTVGQVMRFLRVLLRDRQTEDDRREAVVLCCHEIGKKGDWAHALEAMEIAAAGEMDAETRAHRIKDAREGFRTGLASRDCPADWMGFVAESLAEGGLETGQWALDRVVFRRVPGHIAVLRAALGSVSGEVRNRAARALFIRTGEIVKAGEPALKVEFEPDLHAWEERMEVLLQAGDLHGVIETAKGSGPGAEAARSKLMLWIGEPAWEEFVPD